MLPLVNNKGRSRPNNKIRIRIKKSHSKSYRQVNISNNISRINQRRRQVYLKSLGISFRVIVCLRLIKFSPMRPIYRYWIIITHT